MLWQSLLIRRSGTGCPLWPPVCMSGSSIRPRTRQRQKPCGAKAVVPLLSNTEQPRSPQGRRIHLMRWLRPCWATSIFTMVSTATCRRGRDWKCLARIRRRALWLRLRNVVFQKLFRHAMASNPGEKAWERDNMPLQRTVGRRRPPAAERQGVGQTGPWLGAFEFWRRRRPTLGRSFVVARRRSFGLWPVAAGFCADCRWH